MALTAGAAGAAFLATFFFAAFFLTAMWDSCSIGG
jgi:hypothetical protein